MRRWHPFLLVVLAVALGAGCSKPKPTLAPVPISGKVVSSKGKPVANLIVFFHPQDAENAGTSPNGPLDADGKYALSAVPGRYKVTLLPMPNQAGSAGGADLAAPKRGDPKSNQDPMTRYRNPADTPLELTVPPEGGQLSQLTVN